MTSGIALTSTGWTRISENLTDGVTYRVEASLKQEFHGLEYFEAPGTTLPNPLPTYRHRLKHRNKENVGVVSTTSWWARLNPGVVGGLAVTPNA